MFSTVFRFSSDLIFVGVVCWTVDIGRGDFSIDDIGVFVPLITGEDLILSYGSFEEVTPVPVDFGDWSRRAVDGDWVRGCKTGVCFDGVPFDGIFIFEDRFISDFVDFGVENVSVDT
jgi:hypothetical protein